MKVILFLFLSLPFLWQCKASDDFFKPANFGDVILSREPTTKLYSIHTPTFDPNKLDSSQIVGSATYSTPTIDYLTDENYVFYGNIYKNRDVDTASLSGSAVWMLLEIRKDSKGNIKVNSADTTRSDLYTPLDLYNAKTELPTVLELSGGIVTIGVWPKFSKLTHENLATTNTSRFDYINSLQLKLYTNIVSEGSNSFLRAGAIDEGRPITSIMSIDSLKAIVSGSTWNSVNYPDGYSPVPNYYFFPDFTLSTSVTTPSTVTPTPYYAWNIWTYDGFDKDKGPITEHYLYIYRALTLASRINVDGATAGAEQRDLLRLVFSTAMPPSSDISHNDVYGNLIRLSITP